MISTYLLYSLVCTFWRMLALIHYTTHFFIPFVGYGLYLYGEMMSHHSEVEVEGFQKGPEEKVPEGSRLRMSQNESCGKECIFEIPKGIKDGLWSP